MNDKTYFFLMLVLCHAAGYAIARWKYKARMWGQEQDQDLREDAAYQQGLERGRSEGASLIGDGDAWYKRGFKEGRRHERAVAEKRMAELGLMKN